MNFAPDLTKKYLLTHPYGTSSGIVAKPPPPCAGGQTVLDANRPPHVAIYLRVSTDEQAKGGDSIDTQRVRCIKRLDEEFGQGRYSYDVFQDPGKSGASRPMPWDPEPTKRCRKALWEMLEGLRVRRFTHVCALAIDRIYRDFAGWKVLRRELLEPRGIGILLVTENLDDSPEGDFSSAVLSQVSEYCRRQTRQRSQMTLDKRKAEGYWLGTVPYGYRHESDDEKTNRRRNIVPEPEELAVVRRIFRLHEEGLTPPKIARRLNEEGVLFVKKGKPRSAWYETRVLNILKNPAYAGLVRAKDESFIRGLHWDYRIIEPEDHQRVLDRVAFRRSRLKGAAAFQPFRLFAGIITCGVCGRPLRSSFHSPTPDYRCFGQYRQRSSGAHVHVSAKILGETVLSELEKVATSAEVLAEARSRVAQEIDEGLQPARRERQGLTASLAGLTAKNERLIEALAEGHVTPAEVRPKLDTLSRDREELERRAFELDVLLNCSEDRAKLYERAIRALEDFPRLWEAMEDSEKRELLLTCLERLEARSEGGRVLLRLKIASLPEQELPLLRGKARWTYDKPEGPEGLTPRQLAFLTHMKDGRKLREAAALMAVRGSQLYRMRHEVRAWLEVSSDEEAIALASDWIEKNRSVLPMYGSQAKQPPGRHRRLKHMEYQILCFSAEGMSVEAIAEKAQAPLELTKERLSWALQKAGRDDPEEALEEVIRLGLAPGKKSWQWGTRRRLSG